jgi:hypothetical protein
LTAVLPVLGLLAGGGCITTDSFRKLSEPAITPPCQIVTTWQPEVRFIPDTLHNGRPSPSLVGRMYLFGTDIGYPLAGNGRVVVDIFDETPGHPHNPDAPLEEWRVDENTLQRLLKKDTIGLGYTLVLPWGTYRPDISQIHLRVRYEQPAGPPLFTESSVIALHKDSDKNFFPTTANQPSRTSTDLGVVKPKGT